MRTGPGSLRGESGANVTALLAKPNRTSHAAIAFDELPEFFVRFEAENLDRTTRFGIEGILVTWVRSTELRLARWSWLDLNARASDPFGLYEER